MPGGYAAARFISTMTADSGDFLFIDTGEGNHTIYAVCSGHVRMVRTLPVASDGNPVIRNLETTLKRTFTALQESLGIGVNPSAVFSAGPQAPLLTTGNGSSTLLGVPVKSIDDLRTFPRLKGSLDTPDWQSGHLDIALALALMETETVDRRQFLHRAVNDPALLERISQKYHPDRVSDRPCPGDRTGGPAPCGECQTATPGRTGPTDRNGL